MLRDGTFFLCLCLAVVTVDQSTLPGRVSPGRRGSPLVQAQWHFATMPPASKSCSAKRTREMQGQRSYEATYSRAPTADTLARDEDKLCTAIRLALPIRRKRLAPWPILGQRGCIQHTTSERGTSSAGRLAYCRTSNGYTTCLFSPDPAIFGLGHSESEPWLSGP